MKTDKKNPMLGDYVRARRESLGIDFQQAAEASGLDHTYWRKLEAGQYQSPHHKALAAIAHVLDAPLEELYGLAGYEAPAGLPTLRPYLRSRYRYLPPEAIDQLAGYFDFLRDQYGIPADQPVFPPKPKPDPDTKPKPPTKTERRAT